jgi:hypothetical protein
VEQRALTCAAESDAAFREVVTSQRMVARACELATGTMVALSSQIGSLALFSISGVDVAVTPCL